MRKQWFMIGIVSACFGALGGVILSPQPAGAVSREIVELQQQVSQVLQQQQDLRSAVDTNNATLKTLVQQSLDGVNQLNAQMGSLQKVVQEVQANTGSSISSVTQTTQGLQDNLQEVQARVGKLSQQMNDVQSLLQSIDAKVSGNAPAGGAAPSAPVPAGAPGAPSAPSASGAGPSSSMPSGMPGISADTLYQNALRDFTSGKYDLARQEFSDYIKSFPTNDLASNAQFYLGEIYYAQNDFNNAIGSYDTVLTNYPRSFKLSSSLYKKGMAELELGLKASAVRDLREVERRFAGSDEARRAQAKLREIGATAAARPTAPRQ
ncbi:MAG: tol-pal system protein YbgF [Candidatus Acidiferrales bacterium]